MKFTKLRVALLLAFSLMVGSFGLIETPSSASASGTGYFRWPVDGGVITQGYKSGTHFGIDIAESGTVPIHAAYSGLVTKSYLSSSYGNVVFIQSKIGLKTYETVYAHMQNRAVSAGDFVEIGQFLGYMGSTGDSTGQHLHFEVHQPTWNYDKSNSLNPLDYLGTKHGVLDGTSFNPTNGAYGRVKIDHPADYGANVYDAPYPDGGQFIKRVPGQAIYYVYDYKDGYYDLGSNQWVSANDVIFKRFRAYVNYDDRYGVNVYDAPYPDGGQFIKRLPGNGVYNVYDYKDGYFDLGSSQWVSNNQLIIIDPVFK